MFLKHTIRRMRNQWFPLILQSPTQLLPLLQLEAEKNAQGNHKLKDPYSEMSKKTMDKIARFKKSRFAAETLARACDAVAARRVLVWPRPFVIDAFDEFSVQLLISHSRDFCLSMCQDLVVSCCSAGCNEVFTVICGSTTSASRRSAAVQRITLVSSVKCNLSTRFFHKWMRHNWFRLSSL